jgi:hypothetical protein
MNLAGDDLERLVIQFKVVPNDLERALRSLRDCVRREHPE